MALTFHPSALFPEPYMSPWVADHFVDVTNMVDAIHPGETTSPFLPLVERATARAASLGGQLTEAEMRAVLGEAGWPEELHAQALAVAWCESKWSPYSSGDAGRSLGLWQLNGMTWFSYAGEDPEQWADPVVNARTALATYRYDLARGYEPWTQWSCSAY